MTQAADNLSSTSGQFAVDARPDDHVTAITATGPDRGTALAAIFTGVATAMLSKALPEPAMAAIAVPIRADGPDFPSLIPALAASLFDALEENPALIGPVQIDGILRTDEGMTAWGYILAASTPAPPFGLFSVDDVHVHERDGSVTIRLQLKRDPPTSMNITVDSSDNTLHFSFAVRTESPRHSTLPATIDIGEQGRLLGVEMDIKTVAAPGLRWPPESSDLVSVDTAGGTCYLAIEPEPESNAFVRSVPGEVRMVTDERGMAAEVILPRRGEGYEITYPSGNR